MKKSALALCFIVFSLVTQSALANEWSTWRTLTSTDGVTLDYRYKHLSQRTEVQWRAINRNNSSVYVSIRDKEYHLANGSVSTDSNVGSDVRANDTYTFMPDWIRGDVRSVSAYLHVN